MHILVIPKWYTGRNDPQLGDFVRKQALAVAREHKVTVVFTVPLKGLAVAEEQELFEADGAWELRCYYRPSDASVGPLRKLINLRRYWKASWNGLHRAFQQRGLPDLTHVHILVRPALVAWWLKRTRGVPYILSEQSSEYLDGTWRAKGPLFKAINRWLFRHASAVTVVSAHLGEGLKALGLSTDHQVVPNVVPGTELPLPSPGDPRHFLVVADLVDRTKNVSGVLQALKLAVDRGHDLHLSIIGDGPDRMELNALANSLGLAHRVEWLGRISNAEVLARMGRTGAVIVNSNVETFSVVTGEALALGRPVIATRCGGPEAFITHENGLLITPRSSEELAAAMTRLATDAARDPATIRRTVIDRFSAGSVCATFQTIYQQVLAHG
jgi:glycosyltransferase involved in cell wall biosynthesis